MMSFLNALGSLASNAIRNQVVSSLRADCPAELKEALESLLGNSETMKSIEGFVAAALKNPGILSAANLLGLEMPADSKELLQKSPALVNFLIQSAAKKLGA